MATTAKENAQGLRGSESADNGRGLAVEMGCCCCLGVELVILGLQDWCDANRSAGGLKSRLIDWQQSSKVLSKLMAYVRARTTTSWLSLRPHSISAYLHLA